MSNKEKYLEFKQRMEEAKKAAKTIFNTTFNEMSKEVFEKNPTLVQFSWTQYTPYFNDGDTCYFSTNTSYPSITVLVEGEETEFDDNYDGIPDEYQNIEDDVKEFLNTFDEDDLNSVFGEGKIVVRRYGVETEEYEHD